MMSENELEVKKEEIPRGPIAFMNKCMRLRRRPGTLVSFLGKSGSG
jgi:hypothetical protein